MRHIIIVALSAITLSSCAKNPDAIAPMTMPTNAYSGLSCEELSREHAQSTAALTSVSSQQRSAATSDSVGVFLIGVPISSATGGDKEGLVAQHKGEIIAIQHMQRSKNCK